MAEQRLHSAMAPIDVLTRLELDETLHNRLSAAVRERFLGVDSVRFPRIVAQATGTTTNVFANPNEAPCGPGAGDVWMLRHMLVSSSSLTDTAKYVVYRGSTPSDIANSYGPLQLLEAFATGIVAPSPAQPAVPATGVAQQNVNQFPVQVVISANGATITNVSVNGVTVGTAAGTYTVPANGSISITYSVATPTWVWSNLNAAVPTGQSVNVGWYPGNKAVLIQPGEQIYVQVLASTAQNVYVLSGEVTRIPAEMKGKIL